MRKLVDLMRNADEFLDRVCSVALMISLSLMIGLTLLNIVLRWF